MTIDDANFTVMNCNKKKHSKLNFSICDTR
jgi:hypothetical protein